MSSFVFVVSDLYGGGAQRVLLNTAEALRQRGHNVTVYILRRKIDLAIPEGLRIVNLNVINRATKIFRSKFIEKWQAKKVNRYISDNCPDVIIACSCDRIMRHILDKEVFFWVHINLTGGVLKRSDKAKISNKYRKIYYKKNIIAVSQGVAQDLIENIGLEQSRIRVIPNPIDKAELERLARSNDGVDQTFPKKYFVSVGRIEPRKRHDLLLQAFFESGIESSLLIVGEGDVQEVDRVKGIVYEYGLQEKVFFVGFLKNPYPIIKNAKALILTSEREGLPTVLIESLMLNTPVASFDCPSGPREILTPYLRDWLVDLKDTSALASKIKELDSGSHLIPSQSIDIYSPSSVAEKFESLAY